MNTEQKGLIIIKPNLGGGGSELDCVNLCVELDKMKTSVHIILLHDSKTWESALPASIKTTILGINKYPRKRLFTLRNIFQTWKIWKTLRQLPCHPILAYEFEIGCILGLLKKYHLIKNTTIYRESSNPLFHIKPNLQWQYKSFISHNNKFIYQTSSIEKISTSKWGEKLTGPVAWNPRKMQPLNKVCPSDRGARLCFAGRFFHLKNPLFALRIAGELNRRIAGVTLEIAGQGPMEDEMRRVIHEENLDTTTTFLGFIKDTHPLFLRSRILLLPSKAEGLPNVALEALAAGCIPVCSGGEGSGTCSIQLDYPSATSNLIPLSRGPTAPSAH